MKINDPVWIKASPCSSELVESQSLATGEDLGIVVNLETRDGVEYANVMFPVYGAMFTGIPVSDLEAFDPAAPKSLLGRLAAVFTG
jgi:hypothetical protein